MIESILFAFLLAILSQKNIIPTLTLPTMIPIYIATALYILANILLLLNPKIPIIKYTWTILFLPLISIIYFSIRYGLYIHFLVGMILCLIGIWLNQVAVKSNNCKMPIFPSISYSTICMNDNEISTSKTHQLGNSKTKHIILSDIFDFGYNVFSIGDFCIFSVFGIVMYGVICRLG
jgi:hypothetical protein